MNDAPLAPQRLVDVDDLHVSFRFGRETVEAVKGISLTIDSGQSVAIVGESGSGKSVTARSLVGLIGGQSSIAAERLSIAGTDALTLSERQWRAIRGRQIGFVLQDALVSLDPLRRIRHEIAEVLTTHKVVPRDEIDERVVRLLSKVGVPEPELRAEQYPHQLSGGLRQRALIASAIAGDPALLIADEPTTALDVTVQAQILRLLEERKEEGTALLLISHDLAVVSRVADYLYVMKDGEFVEEGPTREVLHDPQHAYTQQLLAAVPVAHARGTRLSASTSGTVLARPATSTDVVLKAERLHKTFELPDHTRLTAVDDISLELRSGETLGIVGESGSGKSTLSRLLLDLESADSGTVSVEGRAWGSLSRSERSDLRQRIQVIYQDPLSSFDPRYPVRRIIEEPLQAAGHRSRASRHARVLELLDQVGLSPTLLNRRPLQLSGGQRQRVAIARALALRPQIIVCDEPVSALDVSIQAQVLDLLADLQAELGIAYVFVSHHLGVIYHVSDRVLVMKDGQAVETGTVDQIFHTPQHAYTRELLAAVPTLEKPRDHEKPGAHERVTVG